jgi:stringent starvation protein B/glutathione S-transferase
MMVLYSGTTCPFSHRCRFVLFEKGMDFEIRDVDLYNKPEDINVMNPYGQVPILVERDLILYESNIINEYIDERFPHPQLMPGDPVDRARVRLFLLNFEKELFVHVSTLESRAAKSNEKAAGKGPLPHPRPPDAAGAGVPEEQVHAGRQLLHAGRGHCAAAVAPGLLRHRPEQERRPVAQVRRAHLLAPGLHRGTDAVRKGHAQVTLPTALRPTADEMMNALESTSTRPYLIRALYDWCTDNGFTPYVAVQVDESVQVPREYVKDGEIVLNISFDATSSLKLGNEFIEFKARFAGKRAKSWCRWSRVIAIYARENGQGMAFRSRGPLPVQAQGLKAPDLRPSSVRMPSAGLAGAEGEPDVMCSW